MTSSMLDAATASDLKAGRVGSFTAGLGFSVKVNLGGRTNLGREVASDDEAELLEVDSDGARVDSVTAGRAVEREKGNWRRDGTTGDDGSTTGLDALTGAGRRKLETALPIAGVTVSTLSSVVSSSATMGAAVDGRANRGVVDVLLTTEDVLGLEGRTPLLRTDGRRAANPPRLLREAAMDGEKLLLENRRGGRPVDAEAKTGVGLIVLLLAGDAEDRRRKN